MEKADFSMSQNLQRLDKLYEMLIKVGPVARSPKLQYGLGCIFALLSSLAFAEEGKHSGNVGFISNQINTDVGDVPGNRFIGSANFDYKKMPLDPDARVASRRLTLAAQINDQSLLQYSVQEAYLGGNMTSKDSIRFGRQILDWSPIDHTWGFGKLNNRRNFDFFEPGQEGLTGFVYEHRGSNGMRYRVFASGLYIPELSPPVDVNDSKKTIKCRSPWCDAPSSETEVEGSTKSIEYEVEYPSVSEVIFRYSIGYNLGWENDHWSLEQYYVRKPENSLTTSVGVAYNSFEDVVKAKIDPQVYYQDFLGANLKYKNRDLLMYVSGFASRPSSYPDGDQRATEWTEIKTAKIREDYMGGGISRVNADYGIGFNYIARLSPFDRDKESLAQDPRWNQALNFFLMKNFSKLTLSGDVKYDMLTRDRLIMVRGFLNLTKSLLLNAGMNLIGTPGDGKSYWSPYTNNDSLYAGLRYIY
jgi:hypothetical protein